MKVAKELFVAWQEPKSSRYFPVGHLECISKDNREYYQYNYIKGVKKAQEFGFKPFLTFPNLSETYRSEELFSFFANRILSRSRKEYSDFVQSLGFSPDTASPIEILARSGGRRATDNVELFAPPQKNDTSDASGFIDYFFLVHGLRHMKDCAQKLTDSLKCGDRLFVMHDIQNPADPEAVVLRTADYCCVGFLPRYLVTDFWQHIENGKNINVIVEKINPPPASAQQRILCKLHMIKRDGFESYSTEAYTPFAGTV